MLKNSTLLSIFIITLNISSSLLAQSFNNPKFISQNSGKNTSPLKIIKQIKDVSTAGIDGQAVILKGIIQNQVSSDIYSFKDATGHINVEIDNDAWKFLPTQIDDKTRIYIIGELDRKKDGTVQIEAVAILPEKF